MIRDTFPQGVHQELQLTKSLSYGLIEWPILIWYVEGTLPRRKTAHLIRWPVQM